MNESTTSNAPEQGNLSQADLVRLGVDGVAKVSELYKKFDKHFRRKLRDGQWHAVLGIVYAIPVSHCKSFVRLGLPLPEPVADDDKNTLAQAGISNFYHRRMLSSGDFEVRTVDGEEEIRLRPSALPSPSKRGMRSRTTEAKGRTFAQLLTDYFQPECVGCGVAVGKYHKNRCVAELCPYCGLHECTCSFIPADDRRKYDGFSLAKLEAIEFGWFHYPSRQKQWIPCGPDEHPLALPDWQRVMQEGKWDRTLKRYVLSETT